MKSYLFPLVASFVLGNFSMAQQSESIKNKSTQSVSKTPQTQQWKRQFVDDSFDGWQIFRNQDNSKSGWSLDDGVLTFDSEKATGKGNKGLISDTTYRNFEIKFDWKVSPKGNSGFMWGVSLDEKFEHPFESGPEIQVLDPAVYLGDENNQNHVAGALYDLIAPDTLVTKAAGQWNSFHIKINYDENQAVVIHNDEKILDFPLHGPQWDELVANSKFVNIEGFGTYQTGHLVFQDHPGVISYKNVKIKSLD